MIVRIMKTAARDDGEKSGDDGPADLISEKSREAAGLDEMVLMAS
jgi:hypothetical protein